jgi:PKD repeat protein
VVTNGISLNTNNLGNEPVDLGYAWHLLNGSTNFLLDVTSPAFTNGLQPNVTIQIAYYENSDGHLSVWYDSTSGKKLGATYLLSSTNSQWDTQSLSVSDARFSGTNDIILTVDSTNCDPIVRLVRVDTASYLGVPPQLLPPPPVASFTAAPTNGIRPLAVMFTDTSTGTITNLLWIFGDGKITNTAAGAMVSHTFTNASTYTVSLKASGPGGSSTNTQTGLVTVLVPNQPQISGISSFTGNALVLQGSGGPTNGGYYYWLISSTNLTLPLTNWFIVATNPFDSYGNFSNQIPLTPGSPQLFYRVQMP